MKFVNYYKGVLYLFLKLINAFTPKKEKSVFIVPHHNCKTDRYDIINFSSDNALCLFNYLIRENKYSDYSIAIVIDDNSRVREYKSYVYGINNNIQVEFVKREKYSIRYIKLFNSCRYIFSTTEFELFPYRVKKQCISCLCYFTPFKNDFIYSEKQFANISKRNNKTYDYYFTTSSLASRIISSDSGLYYSRFKSFGFPRNDIFYRITNTKSIEFVKEDYSGFKMIVTYTPTFRDYESKSNNKKRGLFGYDDYNVHLLIEVLKKHNAILVAKLHPFQNRDVIERINSPYIRLYNSDQSNYGLYDLLTMTDVLITDYTSTVFDFLHKNKPIIFHFYDKGEYESTRGFAFEPIETVCPGHITNSIESLSRKLDYILSGKDDYIDKRSEVSRLMNYYQDGNSSKRICDFLF